MLQIFNSKSRFSSLLIEEVNASQNASSTAAAQPDEAHFAMAISKHSSSSAQWCSCWAQPRPCSSPALWDTAAAEMWSHCSENITADCKQWIQLQQESWHWQGQLPKTTTCVLHQIFEVTSPPLAEDPVISKVLKARLHYKTVSINRNNSFKSYLWKVQKKKSCCLQIIKKSHERFLYSTRGSNNTKQIIYTLSYRSCKGFKHDQCPYKHQVLVTPIIWQPNGAPSHCEKAVHTVVSWALQPPSHGNLTAWMEKVSIDGSN